ncbi:MAG: hypothetical protein HYZ37_01505 [Candidatus Solibacter usitatus]|nr:hypothetical protein [Candidatus Solibacter usitatus]
MKPLLVLLALVCGVLEAVPVPQRALLAQRGRRFESGKVKVRKPIRTLPRRPSTSEASFPAPRETAYLRTLRRAEDRAPVLLRYGGKDSLKPPADSPIRPFRRTAEPMPELASFHMPAYPRLDDAVLNRWFNEMPQPRRYEDASLDAVYVPHSRFDPFNRNVWKGDVPIIGRNYFLNIGALSEAGFDMRRIPVPSVASSAEPGEYGFFGRGGQFGARENIRLSFEFFRGSAGFRPVDYQVRVTPEFSINYLRARENALTAIDVRQRSNRTDTSVSMQELFFEKRLFTNSVSAFRKPKDADDRGSAYFDSTSLRLGIQRFTSDFRGFIFSDEQPGVRLFGNFGNNVFQYNVAHFQMLEKDSNSGLNRWQRRHQSVSAANLYWNDFLTPGYTLNVSLLYNNDQPTFHLDKNGFLVRPAPIGFPVRNKVRAGYAGISGDGHIGRINVSHAFYQAFGRHDFNTIAAAPQHINAQFAAVEAAFEKDWAVYKTSFMFASGDGNLSDGRARGFDAIVPNQQFAGGGFLGEPALADRGLTNPLFEGGGTNFLNRQPVPLTGTSVFLFGPNSLLPNMRPGLFQGQANFVNPGILLANVGMDAKLTPQLRCTVNVNYARFHRTEVLEAVLFQSGIHHSIGVDMGFGMQYRPWLSDNMVLTGGFGYLVPLEGFNNIYEGKKLISGFVNMRLFF